MLLFVRPLNKPFLVDLGYMALFFGFMAPVTFGGHFVCTSLSWNRGHQAGLYCVNTCVGNVAGREAQSKVPRVPTTTGDFMKCNDSA